MASSVLDSELTLDQFEQEVTTFLDAHLTKKDPDSDAEERNEDERLAAARAWQRERFEAGLGWIMGPREYGGRELTVVHERLYRRLESALRRAAAEPAELRADDHRLGHPGARQPRDA